MTEAEIRALLRNFQGNGERTRLVTVKSVDEDECTCTVTDEDVDITGVLLRCVSGENAGIVNIPDVGSKVLIEDIEDGEHKVVIAIEIIKKRIVIVDGAKFEMSGGNIVVNDGNNDGMIIIASLVTKLNNLVSEVNSLKTHYTSHTHPYVNVSTPATTSPSTPPFTGTFSNFDKNDFENTKFKH